MTKTLTSRLQAATFALVFGLTLMTAATATQDQPAFARAAAAAAVTL